MKEHLDTESREAIVEYRLEKSESAIKEADLLAENGFYDSAVTRLYYACFYKVSALLISRNMECGSHAGVKRMFSLQFGRTGLIDQMHIRTYSSLLQGRQISDYEDFEYQDAESYRIYRIQTESLLNAVDEIMNN